MKRGLSWVYEPGRLKINKPLSKPLIQKSQSSSIVAWVQDIGRDFKFILLFLISWEYLWHKRETFGWNVVDQGHRLGFFSNTKNLPHKRTEKNNVHQILFVINNNDKLNFKSILLLIFFLNRFFYYLLHYWVELRR